MFVNLLLQFGTSCKIVVRFCVGRPDHSLHVVRFLLSCCCCCKLQQINEQGLESLTEAK